MGRFEKVGLWLDNLFFGGREENKEQEILDSGVKEDLDTQGAKGQQLNKDNEISQDNTVPLEDLMRLHDDIKAVAEKEYRSVVDKLKFIFDSSFIHDLLLYRDFDQDMDKFVAELKSATCHYLQDKNKEYDVLDNTLQILVDAVDAIRDYYRNEIYILF